MPLFLTILLLVLLAGCERAASVPPPASSDAPQMAEAVTLDRPPPLEIGHNLGSDDAPLTVVEFSDFGCEACADFAAESLPQLRSEFVETQQVRWRFVPIRQGFYRGGEAARAAECAGEQGKFWGMHDLLLQRQRAWQSRGDAAETFTAYASEAGADPEAFAACYTSDRPDATLRLHDMMALTLGIRGVPTFLVGGQRVIGALEAERFAEILREHLGP